MLTALEGPLVYPRSTQIPTKAIISSAEIAPAGGGELGAIFKMRMYHSCPGLIKVSVEPGGTGKPNSAATLTHKGFSAFTYSRFSEKAGIAAATVQPGSQEEVISTVVSRGSKNLAQERSSPATITQHGPASSQDSSEKRTAEGQA